LLLDEENVCLQLPVVTSQASFLRFHGIWKGVKLETTCLIKHKLPIAGAAADVLHFNAATYIGRWFPS
jgi:hypothetical protein